MKMKQKVSIKSNGDWVRSFIQDWKNAIMRITHADGRVVWFDMEKMKVVGEDTMTQKQFLKLWEDTDALTIVELDKIYNDCIAYLNILKGGIETEWHKDEIPFLKQTMESIHIIRMDLEDGTLKDIYNFADTTFKVIKRRL